MASDRIILLTDFVANQIAAGQVVERPASVVKEMMENSVDAGASLVTVNFRNGGLDMIQVVDDGCGMTPPDARLAFSKHATSKIRSIDDIYSLHSFGFRGEALPSIASVSHVELTTCPEGEELGTKIVIDGGVFASQDTVVCPKGTQISVRNLFYNTPASRKFLDKPAVETRHIVNEFRRVALCYPELSFLLYNDNVPMYNLQPSSLKSRIVNLIGRGISTTLLDVATDTTIARLEGFIGSPSSSRQTNRDQYLFVNGRYFQSPYFHKAVVQAYEKLIPQGTQPCYFLYLTVDPERIDVNVHAQKTKVKFSDSASLWQILNAAVREALAKTGAIPLMDFDVTQEIEIPVFHPDRQGDAPKIPPSTLNPDFNPFEKYSSGGYTHRNDANDQSHPYRPQTSQSQQRFDPIEQAYIDSAGFGQQSLDVGDVEKADFIRVPSSNYAAVERPDGVMLIDLMRARERMLYDNYVMMIRDRSSLSQQLLFPERIVFSIDDASLLKEHSDDLLMIGFDMRMVDEITVEIVGAPAELAPDSLRDVLYRIVDSLHDDTADLIQERRCRMAAILSSAGARAAKFSQQEARDIILCVIRSECDGFTPDGRAIYQLLSTEEIRKRFNK